MNSGYWMFVCPSHISFDPIKKSYEIHGKTWRKVLLKIPIEIVNQKHYNSIILQVIIAIVHMFIIYEAVFKIYMISWTKIKVNEQNFVYETDKVIGLLFQIMFMHTVWFKRKEMRKFAANTNSITFPSSIHNKLNFDQQIRNIKISQCLIMTYFALIFLATQFYVFATCELNPIKYWELIGNEASELYFANLDSSSILYYLQGILHFLLILPTHYCKYFTRILMIVEPLALRHLMVDFLQLVRSNNNSLTNINYSEIFWYYGKVKGIIQYANEYFGYFFLAIVVLIIPYYPIWIGIFFLQLDFNAPLIIVTSSIIFVIQSVYIWIVLTLAAEINAKVNC